jgi:pimeloyl-ACP methyl ester carboxylesterase
MFSDKFVIANGLRLHYLDYGGDGLPWLACIHGLSGNAHSFDSVAAHLAPKYHVISIDVRGRGDSEWGPPTEYLPQHYANDLAQMLDALAIERLTLLGTSMGGTISIMYAGGWSQRVEKLVLNDIGPDIDQAGASRINNYFSEAPQRFADIGEVAAYYRANYVALAQAPEDDLREKVRWSVKPTEDGGLTWKLDPAIRRPIRGGTAQQRLDLWVPFARITAPILVIRGATSDILSPRTAALMRTMHEGVAVVEIPGVGHAPTLLEPESLAAVKGFLHI